MRPRLLVFLALAALAAPAHHARLIAELPAGVSTSMSRPQLGLSSDESNRGRAAQEPEKEKEEQPESLPLKPERKIQFTTTEGTWLSLDVSPDGSTIVFELLGDLYSLPISGGQATRLTSGLPFDSQPRFSPDGTLIAYLSDATGSEQVWTMKADGSERKPISKGARLLFASPTWTPDGRYILVSQAKQTRFDYELWLYHKDGGTGVQLTKVEETPAALGAMVSKDGRYIYYATKKEGLPYNAQYPIWQVARLDRQTGNADVLTDAPGSALRPLLSPDGKWLVYGTRLDTETGLRLYNLETGDERWLAYPIQRDDQESRATRDLLPGYAFTPDGTSIVLNYGGKIHRIDVETGHDTVIPFTASVDLDLGPKLAFETSVEQGPVKARLIDGVSQSPDGTRLAFSSLSHLYVMDLPSGRPHRLTNAADGEFMPAWSPDGRWITYVTWTNEGGYLWRISPEGGEPKRLTSRAGFYTSPVVAPDGTKIVVVEAPRQARLDPVVLGPQADGLIPNLRSLYWVSAEGGPLTYIASSTGLGRPHFANDPARFYVPITKAYVSTRLDSMRLDGTERRTVLKVVAEHYPQPEPAFDIRMAPDGSRALAEVKNQVYLVQVPPVATEPPTVDVESAALPVKKLTEVGGADINWADGGKTATWSLGATFFRQSDGASQPETIPVHVEVPREVPEGTVVLRGAKVITMKGDEVLTNADLVITGNRITAVGARGKVPVPAGAKMIEVSGKTIVPGFVDTHAHMAAWTGRYGVRDAVAWPYLANLAYGVTTTRDPESGTRDVFAYQDLVEAGAMLGPRVFSTGPAIFEKTNFKTLAEARTVLRRYKEYYRTNTLKSYEVGDRNQRQFVVMASKELGIMPTTEGSIDMKLDLTHVLDGFSGNEHALPIVPLYEDVIQLLARSGVFYTPTLLVVYGGPFSENYFFEHYDLHSDPKLRRFTPHGWLDLHAKRRDAWFADDEYIFTRTANSAAAIVRAGGKVCVGSHGQLQGLGYHWEMWALQSGGLTPHETLRSATMVGAEAIGMQKDLGSIEPGKLADLVVLDRDPLQDIHNTNSVRYVLKNGALFDGNTLDEIWPVQKKLPPLYWWDADPKPPEPPMPILKRGGKARPTAGTKADPRTWNRK